MLEDTTLCPLCDEPGALAGTRDVVRVASNVRKFRDEPFTVWRCEHCRSLHAKEGVELAPYYAGYPLQNQRLDFFTRVSFRNRLKILERGGLRRGQRVLDYGCGAGMFVRYLRDAGYDIIGYDPYSPEFADRARLATRFDALISQDVLEHAEVPSEMLQEWAGLLNDGGLLFVGTPNADEIDLQQPELYSFEIHQPYHRHLLSEQALVDAAAKVGFTPVVVDKRFYIDTWVPFNNLAFARAYVARLGGDLDAAFEPPHVATVLRTPKLWFLGYFGRFLRSRGNLLYTMRKQALTAELA